MTLVYVLLTLIGVVALAALAAHFLPRSSNTKIATLEADLNWLYDKVFSAGATTVNVPAIAFPTVPAGALPATPPPAPPAPLLTPITPAAAVAAILAASKGSPGYASNVLSWNTLAWLASDAKAFASWCAGVAAQPECAAAAGGPSDSLGWITDLSQQGQGVLMAVNAGLATAGFPTIPAVDPRL